MRNRIRYGMVVAIGFFLIGAAGRVQLPDPRNSVQALALGHGGILYVGTFGKGMYRSPDGGAHWETISSGLTDPFVFTLLVGSGQEVFAGTARKGIFRTTDGGRNWTAASSGLTNTEVTALLAGNQTLYAGTGHGVFQSTDSGRNWKAYNTGMERILVRSLIMDGRGFLFAGTAGKGLYRRGPNHPAWEQVTRGFQGESGILENFIRTLTLHPDGTMYAGTFDGGVYISQDGGHQWTGWSEGMTNHSIRAFVLGRDKTLYVGTGKGIFARAPSDTRWSLISKDLEDGNIQSMVVDESGKIFAGTAVGLYKGTIRGGWASIAQGLFRPKEGA